MTPSGLLLEEAEGLHRQTSSESSRKGSLVTTLGSLPWPLLVRSSSAGFDSPGGPPTTMHHFRENLATPRAPDAT